jgi:oxygen-independent coproporphyrinogen-3 oxidase
MTKGIYLHIPFCRKKCAYCDFPSTDLWREEDLALYLEALLKDLERSILPWKKYTLYIGGGTPSLLPMHSLDKLLDTLHALLPNPAEFTFEANPESLNREKLEMLSQGGVTRLSLGVQSFKNNHLAILGRIHTAQEAKGKAELARRYFENFNLDLIFGIPGQDTRDLELDLETALELNPTHLSVYSLTLEEDTLLFEASKEGGMHLPREEQWLEMFNFIPAKLKDHGFQRYEISNFARPGWECRHNLVYWENGEYLGIGASAVSHLSGKRLSRAKDPMKYMEMVSKGISPVVETESLPPWQKALETAMVGLRTTRGVNPGPIEQRWKVENKRLKKLLDNLKNQNLLEKKGERYCIPPHLFSISNEILAILWENHQIPPLSYL